jgi:hypothetical protein
VNFFRGNSGNGSLLFIYWSDGSDVFLQLKMPKRIQDATAFFLHAAGVFLGVAGRVRLEEKFCVKLLF